MNPFVRRLAVLVFVLCGLPARPALAHYGPPFPVLVDQRVGPYVASVWTDPNIGTGLFFVVLEAPKGHRLPAKTTVRIGIQPVSKRLPEVLYDLAPQAVDEGARYFTNVQFDRGGMWRARVLIDGSEGGGQLTTEVEPTPAGILGPLGSLVYALPFLAVGFLWLKATLRRRGAPATLYTRGTDDQESPPPARAAPPPLRPPGPGPGRQARGVDAVPAERPDL